MSFDFSHFYWALYFTHAGAPTRYIILDPSKCRDLDWDSAISQGCEIYSHRMHNIFCDNCHSHVAKCLNIMGYGDKKSFDMVNLAVWVFFNGSFVSVKAFVVTFLPFLVLTAGIILMSLYIWWFNRYLSAVFKSRDCTDLDYFYSALQTLEWPRNCTQYGTVRQMYSQAYLLMPTFKVGERVHPPNSTANRWVWQSWFQHSLHGLFHHPLPYLRRFDRDIHRMITIVAPSNVH